MIKIDGNNPPTIKEISRMALAEAEKHPEGIVVKCHMSPICPVYISTMYHREEGRPGGLTRYCPGYNDFVRVVFGLVTIRLKQCGGCGWWVTKSGGDGLGCHGGHYRCQCGWEHKTKISTTVN
jgi:hypothetical protein